MPSITTETPSAWAVLVIVATIGALWSRARVGMKDLSIFSSSILNRVRSLSEE
jgi:hypothetical protein